MTADDTYVSPIWERLAAQRAENERRGKHLHMFACPETVEHAEQATPTYESAVVANWLEPLPDASHRDTTPAGAELAAERDSAALDLETEGRPERYVGRHSDQLAERLAALPASKHWPVKA